MSGSWSGTYLGIMLSLLQSSMGFVSPGTSSFAGLTLLTAENQEEEESLR